MEGLLIDNIERWIERSEDTDRFPTTIAMEESGLARSAMDAKITERKLFKQLLDEIKHYYAPLPRDNKGIPFNEGDTVWSIDPDTKYSAKVTDCIGDTIWIVWEDGALDYCDKADLTHEMPDSLEKLRDDVDNILRNLCNYNDTANQIKDRFSALIERGA